jgi:hypothetical protein
LKSVTTVWNNDVPGRGTFVYAVQAYDSWGMTSALSNYVTITS